MTLEEFSRNALDPAFAWLPDRMDSIDARQLLLTTALQESKLQHRRQMGNGPARSFYQFERGGGVLEVLTNKITKAFAIDACRIHGVEPVSMAVWEAIENNDVLASIFARLNYYRKPKAIPASVDVDGSWMYYLQTWAPGKPHPETWPAYHQQVQEFLKGK